VEEGTEDSPVSERYFPWWIAAICSVGSGLRLIYAFVVKAGAPLQGDALYYHGRARLNLDGHWFVDPSATAAFERADLERNVYAPLRQADPDFLEEWPTPVSDAWLIWYYPLMALAACGAVILKRCHRPIYPLLAMFIVPTLSAFLTYGNYRFRVEAELATVLLAAVTLDAIWSSVAGLPRPEKVACLHPGPVGDEQTPCTPEEVTL
jgi:hypothetical protein